MPFEVVEHIADVGFRAWGETLGNLFEQAAEALISFGSHSSHTTAERNIRVQGEDYESLLVNWLSEILYLFDSGEFVPVRFHVGSVSPTQLDARIEGEPGGARQWNLIVKAITYHEIEVRETDGRWEARVILDV